MADLRSRDTHRFARQRASISKSSLVMVLTFLALHAHAQPTPMPARFAYEEATIDALQMGIAGGRFTSETLVRRPSTIK